MDSTSKETSQTYHTTLFYLQADYKAAVKEVKRLREQLKAAGILVD